MHDDLRKRFPQLYERAALAFFRRAGALDVLQERNLVPALNQRGQELAGRLTSPFLIGADEYVRCVARER